jgi:ABC-2 type transport system ATP-binding protein
VIRVSGLEKSFGAVRAVAGVELLVPQGQTLVLLGQNGAGKSTTLRCLGGILRPDAGVIELDGLRLPEGLEQVRRRLGVVPDQARLYGRTTALEYLDHCGRLYGVPQPERGRKIAALLERFELWENRDQALYGFSRGMAQKVALIRATLHDPDWLFCDEPTSGLDPVAAAEMRRYLDEQRRRGAALIVTTHILSEAELMADRLAIMRRGRVVRSGTLAELQVEAHPGRRFSAHLSAEPSTAAALLAWLARAALQPELEGRTLTYRLPWELGEPELAAFASSLQRRLGRHGSGFYSLEEEPETLESVYVRAMGTTLERAEPPADSENVVQPPTVSHPAGINPARLAASLLRQPPLLSHLLRFYVSSWWRRGDLSWVLYLNAFVLLLVSGASLFGAAPALGGLADKLAGPKALAAGLLLPLFFMSFALLESIKSSIGIWWEKAQQSLEVLLYAPLDDASLIWMEVLPGMFVSAVWVTVWMTAGLALLTLFGRPAPWDLVPVFGLVGALTAYWAAMGRMLGFMLFPREGAAGGAWSFLLSPVSAAVADLPLALFVFRSPLAPLSLLLPLAAGLALTVLTGASFDRERLLETGVGRSRPRRQWLPVPVLRRRLAALVVGLALAAVPAAGGAAVSSAAGWHSWTQVRAAAPATAQPESPADPRPASLPVNTAAAVMAGVVGALGLTLMLLAINFAAFFLLGIPEVLLLPLAAAAWGIQLGFGGGAPLAGWFGLAGGIAVLGLAINTAAALPLYTGLAFGAGSRIDRLRAAWADYFAIFRSLVLPLCALFGLCVAGLLIKG